MRESGPVFITEVFSKQAAQHVSNEGRAGYGEHVQVSYDHGYDRQTDAQLSEQSKSCSKHQNLSTGTSQYICLYPNLIVEQKVSQIRQRN